jgi:hypothetical protein
MKPVPAKTGELIDTTQSTEKLAATRSPAAKEISEFDLKRQQRDLNEHLRENLQDETSKVSRIHRQLANGNQFRVYRKYNGKSTD